MEIGRFLFLGPSCFLNNSCYDERCTIKRGKHLCPQVVGHWSNNVPAMVSSSLGWHSPQVSVLSTEFIYDLNPVLKLSRSDQWLEVGFDPHHNLQKSMLEPTFSTNSQFERGVGNSQQSAASKASIRWSFRGMVFWSYHMTVRVAKKKQRWINPFNPNSTNYMIMP